MLYRWLADGAVLVHAGFVVFVVGGGFLVGRWPRLAWAHVPAFLWAAGIEFLGLVCPLTYLENHFRRLGAQAGYPTSFVEHYILPVIYPDLLLDGPFPRWGFIAIGAGVLAINGAVYWHLWRGRKRRRAGLR